VIAAVEIIELQLPPASNRPPATSHAMINKRPFLAGLLLLVLFCCSGATCSRTLRYPFMAYGPPAPEVLAPGATLQQVIEAVNQNADRVLTYSTNNASLSLIGMPTFPLLRCNLAAKQPHLFRLQASTLISGDEIDIGSSDELLWFWVKENKPPALYYCRHDQYVGSSAQRAMPVDPQWFLSALGLVRFEPGDRHDGPLVHGNDTLEIQSVVQTSSGTYNRSTVIDAKRAWVLKQFIYDGQGTLLASAEAKSHRYYPEHGVSLPQLIEIRMPAAQLAFSIDVGSVQLNQLAENRQLWTLPEISGSQRIDLGAPLSSGTLPAQR
jgi:hypothetical protein